MRGSGSSSPALPSPPPQTDSIATELDDHCPICLDSWEEAGYVLPCCHRFCLTCIQRWDEINPDCPLCKRRMDAITPSVQTDYYFPRYPVRLPPASPDVPHQAPHSPAASPPWTAGRLPRDVVDSLEASEWASLFSEHPFLLHHLLPWLHQVLELVFEDDHQRVAIAEDIVMSCLVGFGPDKDLLVWLLRLLLRNRTATFVDDLVSAVTRLCGRGAHYVLELEGIHAHGGWEGSPADALSPAASRGGSPAPSPAPSGSSARDNVDELPSTPTAALAGHAGSSLSAPIPVPEEQEEPQEEPEDTVPGPSASSQGRACSPGETQRPPKRRAGSPEDSSAPNKRPAHQQR